MEEKPVEPTPQAEPPECGLDQFKSLIGQFKDLYLDIHSSGCTPCKEMIDLIKQADVPCPIVTIPESCSEIQDFLDIKVYPTIIKIHEGKIVAKYEGNPQDTIEHMKKGE